MSSFQSSLQIKSLFRSSREPLRSHQKKLFFVLAGSWFLLLLFKIFVIPKSNSPFKKTGPIKRKEAPFAFPWKREQPLVSVILTTYNVELYINDTIELLLAQSHWKLQVIVVDDASSDKTVEYVRSFQEEDDRIEVVQISTNTLGGVGTPANIGIDRAVGKYIAFLDGDDLPKKNFISKLVAVAESSGADLTIAEFSYYDDTQKTTVIEHDMQYWPNESIATRSQNKPISPHEHPAMLFLSPVPWRKLYTRKMLFDNNIRFPEGDYFFEDTDFHWAVHVHSPKIAFVSESLVDYRIGRTTQTTNVFYEFYGKERGQQEKMKEKSIQDRLRESLDSMKTVQIMKCIPNLNNAGRRIMKCPIDHHHCGLMRREFLNWLETTTWVTDILQEDPNKKLMKKASSLYFRTIAYWQNTFGTNSSEASSRISTPETLLSIIIPTHNVGQFLPNIERMIDQLTVSTEVIFVDDNSTDDTAEKILELTETRDSWFLLHTNGGKPGIARNLGQLLAEGKYVFFLDSDDHFNATVLDFVTRHAIAEDLDVLMIPYTYIEVRSLKDGKVEYIGTKDMEDKDKWQQASPHDLLQKKIAAAMSINYPWNKIMRTDLLMRENVFHGPTVLNEDVQHHWHVILAAHSIEFFSGGSVVKHRIFTGRTTMTDVKGSRRMSLIDALAMTNRVLVLNGINEQESFRRNWRLFCEKLVNWGRTRITNDLKTEYEKKVRALMRILGKKQTHSLL